MQILNNLDNLKQQYNSLLVRYYKGCTYILENNVTEKEYKLLLDIKKSLENILSEIEKQYNPTSDEILSGFKLGNYKE